ncbi:MAG: hypothetical protein FJ356_04070 [Thaumarchaeota archaeon]|nr:hypothetical protein [Nitrososphaerota archaeon]
MKLLTSVTINPEFFALVPRPTNDEYEAIKSSIQKDGQLEPIVVWNDKTSGNDLLLDGHTRYKICTDLGIEPKFIRYEFAGYAQAKKFVIDVNLHRRHLSDLHKVQLALISLEIEKGLAQERKESTFPKKGQKGFQKMSMPDGNDTGRTNELVAKKIGLSPRTVARLKLILDSDNEKLKQNVASGITSPAYAEKQIKKHEALIRPISLPKGVFNRVYCDAPWQYDYELSGSPDYPTLSTEEIINLKDIDGRPISSVFTPDCVLFFWSPKPKFTDALRVIEAWGFTFKTFIVWRKVNDGKSQRGTGHYVWSTCECLIIATKGKPGTPISENMMEDYVEAPRGKRHSEKPELFHSIIMKMFPNGRFLELFARKQIDGWECWGNQLDGTVTKIENKTSLDDFSQNQ